MLRKSLSLIALALLAVLAAPVSAELFIVTLTNGRTFETQYQPVQSTEDEGKMNLLTDTGNWISLSQDIVASVTSQTEAKGFGIVIDTQTIALGWDPTSIAVLEEEEGAAVDPSTQLLNYLVQQDQAQSVQQAPAPFSNELVVEPGDAGGIPMWMTGITAPPQSGRR